AVRRVDRQRQNLASPLHLKLAMTPSASDSDEITSNSLAEVRGGMQAAGPRAGFGKLVAIGTAALMTPGMVLMTTQTIGSSIRHASALHDKEHRSWPSAIASTAKQAVFGPMLMD